MNRYIRNFIVCAATLLPISPIFAIPPAPADKIKAAYIYQFTQFITWPESTSAKDLPFNLCILGRESIGKELEPLNQRRLDGRNMRITYLKTIAKTSTCNILYIAKTEQYRVKAILEFLHNKPVLTISSIPDFAQQGGMIDFVILDNKIRLRTNIAAARHARLDISAKLLEVSLKIFGNGTGIINHKFISFIIHA